MRERKKPTAQFVICIVLFALCAALCLVNYDYLKRPVFQKKTFIQVPSLAKYEKDGNLYIIDSGSFRLISMTPEGKINYTINIDKVNEYTKMYDCTVDEAGNLYVYAAELAYDAYLTERDMIRKYDRNGNFVEDILVMSYPESLPDNPHTFPQFGSLRCEEGILTFSRTQKDRVVLYRYDTFRDELSSFSFFWSISNFSVAQLALRDFENFIYTTRDGNIFEVKNGETPLLRASFDFTPDNGGYIPWGLDYDSRGNIVFFDMVSGALFRIAGASVEKVIPQEFFDKLSSQGVSPTFAGFGFFEDRFAGVYGDVAWYYDGAEFRTYQDGVTLSLGERIAVSAVQFSLVLGVLAFLLGIYLLFVHILDRYVSLLIKQTIVIIPLTIAGFAVLYTVTFNIMTKRLNTELFNALNSLAVTAVGLIDGDDVEVLKSTKDFNSDAYKRLSQTLKEIVGNNRDPWNKAYYASIYVGKNFEYWAVISNDEANLYRKAFLLEEGTEEYDLFMSGKPVLNTTNVIDGLWLYSEVPIYNSRGKITGMFEVGLDMTGYHTSNLMQLREVSFIAAFICVIILFALIMVMFFIVRQLASVARVLADISRGNYSARVSYRARDELGRVTTGLNHMAVELQNQFKQINSLSESSTRFVPIQFMEYLGVSDITKLKLGDYVQRDLTVLFFDIRAFSINSEMMTARENFLFINEVLGVAGPILRNHRGFVDKYLGDAAMALFVNALDAVQAGIEVYRKLILDNTTRAKIGGDGINIGVGLHSGSVMMGIVGENERLSSTVISKNVNLASRMESLTKQTKSGMLITRDTMDQIAGNEDKFRYRFIGMVQVAGVNEVVGVFDMLDALPEKVCKKRLATKKFFESGIRKYHTKDYQAACVRFESVLEADPDDVCAMNCLAETKKRMEQPDLPSVFVFDKK